MADPYRIPSGHKGGGRFAKRGTVGEAIVRAAKSVYHGMADAELDAERTDLIESIDHSKRNKAAATERLAAQVERTTRTFGERRSWPASSEDAVRRIEAEVAAADKAISDATGALDELDTARAERIDPNPDLDGPPAFVSKLAASYLADPRAEARAFDALPPDAIVKLYHGTSEANADGIADTEVAGYAPRPGDDISKIAGHKGLYVAPTFRDARNYAGNGGTVIAFHARRGDIEPSPEARGATAGQALYRSYEGAILRPDAPLRVVDRIDGITNSLGQRGDGGPLNERQATFGPDIERVGLNGWETTQPWQYGDDDIAAGRAPGWLRRTTRPGTHHASYVHDNGVAYIEVSDDYLASTPEQRRAALYHEAGHILDSMLHPADKARAHDVLLDGPNFAPSHDNADELVAETFARMHTDPQWLADNQPELLPWIIDRADANWMPVPDAARTVTPRQRSARRGDPIDDIAALPIGARFENRLGTEFTRTADGATDERGREVSLDYLTGRATADGTPIPNPAPQQFTHAADTFEANDMPTRAPVDPPAPKSQAATEKALRKLSDGMTAWLGVDPVGDIQIADDVPTARTIHSQREGSIVVVNPSMIAHPEDGGSTLRFITHEAAHTISPERTLPGFSHDIEEGGAELLSQMHWVEAYRTTENDAIRVDGRWVQGPAALWGHGAYHDLTRDLLGRVLAENPDATRADVKARLIDLMRSDHYQRMDFHESTNEAPPATSAQLAWLLGGDAADFDRVIAARGERNDLVEAHDAPVPAPQSTPAGDVAGRADSATAAAERARRALADVHHEALGNNGITLPTFPMIVGADRWRNQPLPADAQAVGFEYLFNPPPTSPIPPPHKIDGPGPIRAIAVNLDTGQVIGSSSPWTDANAPLGGRWVTLPADDPDAPALAAAGWLATPEAQQYITSDVLPALRHGDPPDDHFPSVVEEYQRRSNDILDRYRGDRDLPVRRVTDPEVGTYYTLDESSPLTLDGDAARFADFAPDGSVRLWASPAAVADPDPTDPLSRIDYSDADDPDLPWDQRVAALAAARIELQRIVGNNPGALFSQPSEADLANLFDGHGGQREFAVLNAFDRFGESLDRLIRDRTAEVARQPDKVAVTAKLRDLGVPNEVVDFIEAQPWHNVEVTGLVRPQPGAPDGGGMLTVTFPDDPDTRVTVFTSALPGRAQTHAAWEFSADYQIAHPDTFATLPPSGRVTAPADGTGRSWYADVVDTGNLTRPGENTAAMTAHIDTLTALGIDMGTDDKFYVAAGRNIDAENAGMPDYGAVPMPVSDADGVLAATIDAGLRPYPKSWTATLGAKLTRVAVDPDRTRPLATSNNFPDVGIIDVPSIENHPEYADTATHEFAHLFERTVGGLMLMEQWHFIQRLRAETARSNKRAQWRWDERQHGYVDEFGDVYMGRIYTSAATGRTGVTAMAGYEILSTVAQTTWGGYSDRTNPDLDPQARRFMLALMAVVEPDPPARRWRP